MEEQPPQFGGKFGGKPGDPVPEVDPKDVKAVWELRKDVERRRPEGSTGTIAISNRVFERVCTPGANVVAVAFRTMKLSLLCALHPDFLAELTNEAEPVDAVFSAIAQVSMEWPEIGVTRYSPPFDVEQFERLLREAV